MGGDIIGTDKGVYDVSTLHGCYSYLIRECNLPGRACEMVNKLYVMANIAELAAENTHSAPAAVDELIEAVRKANGLLDELIRLGKEGMEPDYTRWITFHDKVAELASEARAALTGRGE